MNKPAINKATKFWQEVNELFPYSKISEWIKLISNNQVDYYRNGGLALEAIGENSKNKRGIIIREKWESNKQKLNELIKKHDIDLQN